MSLDAEASRLLQLPGELRRAIIVLVICCGRSSAPCFNQELIDNSRRNQYLHGNGLRAANRQLQSEVDLAIEQELKSGKVDIPFVLDVLIVKDIGVFPYWRTFPYQPQHLKLLTIHLRIVRPGSVAVPDEWVEAARYTAGVSYSHHSPAIRNIMMAISIYAFSCISAPRDPQANVIDAHLVPSSKYVTDELHIFYDKHEYEASGRIITTTVPDPLKESQFFKAGYVQFGREVFEDYSTDCKDNDVLENDEDLLARGMYACHQLKDRLDEKLCGMSHSSDSIYFMYLRVLARSVGELSVSSWYGLTTILPRPPGLWVDLRYALDNAEIQSGSYYTKRNIARVLKKEVADGWDQMAKNLRTVQIRRSHGWVNEDDA
ncbi:hypothetical protein VHEMI09245 [[Torrubiella] hemipterigena]|uniref:Uncharacterized protein n=1 Tax=[Torrubiella] hemipterigena TaxID=1531966 RepID=A0A0A1TFZ2_9HYPO|nr:hypothetical protein VHEMI09245 [[Torrubiella] hemipterigena]